MATIYDEIGTGYAGRRRPDARIAAAIRAGIGGATAVLNIGAGTGSYEHARHDIVAVEPSQVMIRQRVRGSAPVVQAVAEALPFRTAQFDLAMGILTLHHWSDWRLGLREAARVAGGRVLLFTWIGYPGDFWLLDYFPDIARSDRGRFPSLAEYRQVLGEVSVTEVAIPHDCRDGFLCAYWRRPEAYLDPRVRAGISTFSLIGDQHAQLERLREDLQSGRWASRYRHLLELDALDCGYRMVCSTPD